MAEESREVQDGFFRAFAIMNAIMREMKEIPELPSEKPKDIHHIQRVEFPQQGGVLS